MADNLFSGLGFDQDNEDGFVPQQPQTPSSPTTDLFSGLGFDGDDTAPSVPATTPAPTTPAPQALTPPEPQSRESKVTADDLAAGKFESAAGGFIEGLGEVAAGAVRGLGEIGLAGASAISSAAGKPIDPNFKSPIIEAGNKISDFFSNVTDINPEFQDTNLQRVSQGLGSAAGFVAGGAAGAALKVPAWLGLGALGVTGGADQQVQDYVRTIEQQGGVVDLDIRGKAAFAGGALGSIEAIPFTKALKRLEGVSGGIVSDIIAKKVKGKAGRVLGEAFAGGLEELTQEAIQATGTNLIASGLLEYDPERKTFKDVGEAATTGGQVGFLLNGLMSSIGMRKGGRFEEVAHLDRVNQDLSGLDATQDEIKNIARDTKGNLLLPLSDGNQEFSDKPTQKLFSKYVNLAQLRQAQQDRGADLTRTDENITQIVAEMNKGLALDEDGNPADPVKSQDAEETLRFITRNEANFKKTQLSPDEARILEEEIPLDEDIQAVGVSPKREGFVSREAKENAEAFQADMQARAEEKGFDINNVVEEVDLADTQAPLDPATTPQVDEEIVVDDPLITALRERGLSDEDISLGNIPDSDITEIEDIIATDINSARAEGRNSLLDTNNREVSNSAMRDAFVKAQKDKDFREIELRTTRTDREQIDKDYQDFLVTTESAAGGTTTPTFTSISSKIESNNQAAVDAELAVDDILQNAEISAEDVSIDAAPIDPASVDSVRSRPALRGVLDRLPDDRKDVLIQELRNNNKRLIDRLYTSRVAGIPNGVAYDDSVKKRFQASIDIDSLGFLNDQFGHVGGDALIKKVATAIKKEVSDTFHISGDEIYAQADSRKKLVSALRRAQQALKKESIEGNKATTGEPIRQDGLSFSFGIANDIKTADENLFKDKKTREGNGTRSAKGTEPSGFSFYTPDNGPALQVASPTTVTPAQSKLSKEQLLSKSVDDLQTKLHEVEISELKGDKVDPEFKAGIQAQLDTLEGRQVKENNVSTTALLELETSQNNIDSELIDVENKLNRNPKDKGLQKVRDRLLEATVANQELRKNATNAVTKLYNNQSSRTLPVASGVGFTVESSVEDGEIVIQSDVIDNQNDIVENAPLGVERSTGLTVIEDISNAQINPGMKSYRHRAQMSVEMSNTMEGIISKLDPEIGKTISIQHVTDLSEVTDPLVIAHINRTGRIPMGLHIPPNKSTSGKAEVYTFAGKHKNVSELTQTLMHEVVGHFGMSGLLGKGWDGFLKKVYTSPGMKNKIYNETHQRWRNIIIDNPLQSGDKGVVVMEQTRDGLVPVRISTKAMEKLTDEHIANLAARFADPSFRAKMNKKEKGLFQRSMAMIKHFLSKIGIGRKVLTDDQIIQVVNKSFNRIFRDVNLSYDMSVKPDQATAVELGMKMKDNSIRGQIPFSNTLSTQEIQDLTGNKRAIGVDRISSITPTMAERLVNIQLNPEEAAQKQGAPESDIIAINKLRTQDFGSTNTSAYQKRLTSIGDRLGRTRFISALSPLGKLQLRDEYRRITTGALSKITEFSNNFSRTVNTEFNKLNSIQRQELYDFYTSKDSDVNQLNVPEEMKDLARQSKDKINDLSAFFRDNNLLSEEAFAENVDAYLPRRYLAYLEQGIGSGKQGSFMNYLKSKKDLPADVRASLGEIKDPAFLVAETISIMSRDAALIDMFNTLNQTNKELGLDWMLGGGQEVEHTFQKFDKRSGSSAVKEFTRKMSIPEAQEKLKTLNQVLTFDEKLFLRTDDQTQSVIRERDSLVEAISAAEESQNVRLQAAAEANGIPVESIEKFKSDNYRQIPDQKRFGRFRGAFVRKEIFEDIKNTSDVFDSDELKSLSNTIFGDKGLLVKGHRIWKNLMVPLNPPSWFRNGLGNAALLDISSNRNSVTLSKWLVEEGTNAFKGNPSEFWSLAEQQGLFGNTFAATELQGIRRGVAESFDSRFTKEEEGLSLNKVFPQLSDAYGHVMEVASKNHGLMEGLFKTVKLRDHLTEWSAQNNRDWRDLQGPERDLLMGEATKQANQAIFDYGDVPNFLSQFRKYPLGAPFITFTYKSFPQVIRSMARRPQKFIKYLAMPMIMQALVQANNDDLDDDDYDKLLAGLPRHVQEKANTYVLPWKNANKDWTYIDLGYLLPWGQFSDMAAKANNMFVTDSLPDSAASAATISLEMTRDLGFLGGPVPTMISAFTTGVDDFTGRSITTKGASKSEQAGEMITYLTNLMAPSFISSHGTFGRLLDNAGFGDEKDFTGADKETFGQILPSAVGLNVKTFNVESARQSNVLDFKRRESEILKFRSKTIRDKNLRDNPEQRALKIKEINVRLKNLREERRKFFAKSQ